VIRSGVIAGALGLLGCEPTRTVGWLDGETTSTGGAATDPTGTDAGDETTGTQACDPAPEDSACESCLKDECCELFTGCVGDNACACMLSCLETLGPPACAMQCAPGGVYGAILPCLLETCAPACSA
jgi:hypothetical protein